jgi:hypothetical protein
MEEAIHSFKKIFDLFLVHHKMTEKKTVPPTDLGSNVLYLFGTVRVRFEIG